MRKYILYPFFIVGFGLGAYVFFSNRAEQVHLEEQASIVLERIQEVEQLILVEGSFAEIYTYAQNEKLFFDLWPVEKKVIVLIDAKAHVGYDLTKVKFEVDKDARTVIIQSIPKEIIILESDVQYYDIQQSQFYPITGKDLTTIQERSKDLIKEQVMQSQLPQIAQERLPVVLENILFKEFTQDWEIVTQ